MNETHSRGFPGGTRGKELACQCRRHKRYEFDPWVGKILWRMTWQLTPIFLPRELALMHTYNCHVCAKSFQSCLTLCDPMCYSPPGFPVNGILLAIVLDRAAMPSSRWSSHLLHLLRWQKGSLPIEPPRKPLGTVTFPFKMSYDGNEVIVHWDP